MKLGLIGFLVVVLAGACGNAATSGEHAATPTPPSGGAEQGSLPVGQTRTTGQEQQAAQIKGGAPLPNAGMKVEAAPPPRQPPPRTPTGVTPPGPPRPIDTGDPCPWCRDTPPGRR